MSSKSCRDELPVAAVLLEERGGQRRLPIWIAGSEATLMALRLAGMGLPARPSAGT